MRGRSTVIPLPKRSRRHRSWKPWWPFLLLCLLTAGAWAVQIEIHGSAPEIAKPAILHGGDAWRSGRRNAEPDYGTEGLSGPVTHVRDGDTIEVSGTAIRIANLDCAERGTRMGDLASRGMRELARESIMHCQLSRRRSYDRQVGICRLSNGRDVGMVLIAERLCRRWR